ncbi:MAG: hypothetical protein JSR37_01940, partial [Verrucomicrobia bacterium]|nr:hypothetical protein [Verrucomicrobiota bacterium]
MKIIPNVIQSFFTETIPDAGKAFKSRIVQACSRLPLFANLNSPARAIKGSVFSTEDWKKHDVAEKYSAAIKLLTTKLKSVGPKNMLSKDEVCLVLCCWIHMYRGKEVHDSVKELIKELRSCKLLNDQDPWFPHSEINSLQAIKTYMQDLKKPPTATEIEQGHHSGPVRVAIPGYLLELFDPAVLIPRSVPIEVADGDIKFMKALTPIHPTDAKDIPTILNELASLLSDEPRRAQFLAWWSAAPLQPVVSPNGEVSAQAAFFARSGFGFNDYGYTDIHLVVDYIRDPTDPQKEKACIDYLKKLIPEAPIAEKLAPELSEEAKKRFLKLLPDAQKIEMKASIKDAVYIQNIDVRVALLTNLLEWVKDPERLSKLTDDHEFLKLLPDLSKVPVESAIDLSKWLRDSYGSDAIAKFPELKKYVDYVADVFEPLQLGSLNQIDLNECRMAIETWDDRESWSEEQMAARYHVVYWVRIYLSQNPPEEILQAYPKLQEVMAFVAENRAQLEGMHGALFQLPIGVSIPAISRKVAALAKALPGKTSKEDRLTLNEFYFLKSVLVEGRALYALKPETVEMWKAFRDRFLLLPEKSAVFVNFARISNETENPIKRIAAKVIGMHTNISVREEKELTAHGVSSQVYSRILSGFIDPKVESFELNLDRLAEALPEAKREKFKELFVTHLINATDQRLSYPNKDEQKSRFKSLFRIEAPLDPSRAGFTEQKTSICT